MADGSIPRRVIRRAKVASDIAAVPSENAVGFDPLRELSRRRKLAQGRAYVVDRDGCVRFL